MARQSRIWNTLRTRALRRELDEELRLHLDLRTRDLERAGMDHDTARAEAAKAMGNLTLQKERMTDMDVATWLVTIVKDLRFASRQFARNPLFTAVAILSLALGIGANTAIFSVFDAAILKSLPVRDPDQLVALTDLSEDGTWNGSQRGERSLLTYTEYVQLRDRTKTLSGVCAAEASFPRWSVRIARGAQEEARGRLISENYFSVLGVRPIIGHFFDESDATGPGKDPYAVISYDYWQQRFGGKSDVIGTPIHVYNANLTIVGVAARGFHGDNAAEHPDLWIPMMMQPLVMPGRDWLHEDLSQSLFEKRMWLQVFGRRKPGATIPQVQTEMNVLFRQIIEASYPTTLSARMRKEFLNQRIRVRDARTGTFGDRDEFSQQLLILMAVAGLVLLIACANIANLLLARATARYKEVGIRLSIGASKGRLVRQFLTENLLLAIVGGLAGVAFAFGGVRALTALLSQPDDPLALSTSLDWRVLSFTIGITLLTGLLFGLAPAFRATRVNINETLKDTSHATTAGSNRLNFAKSLIAGQAALSLVLVVGAGLFLRTLWNLQSVQLGYSKESLLTVHVDGLSAGYKDVQLPQLYRRIAERLQILPGIRSLAYSGTGLFSGGYSGDPITVEGFVPKTENDRDAHFDRISPGYFSTLAGPMLLGREFNTRDTVNSARVCIINEAFARHFFAGGNPIGKHVTDIWADGKLTMEVVGVAKDVRDHSLRGGIEPQFYVPIAQCGGTISIPSGIVFEIRTTGDPNHLVSAIRKSIGQVNENLPILDARVLTDLIADENAQPRLIARLCATFATIALLLAAIGLYGVLSYSVARRTNEIGILLALGAHRFQVIAMILCETGTPVIIGIAIGIAATCGVARLIASRLYGLSPTDPMTLGIATAVLVIVALIAGYIPAARASRIDPVTALRHE